MRAVVQRVAEAGVAVAGENIAAIDAGVLIYLGVGQEDGEKEADYLAEKIAHLRIFEDDAGKMNVSVLDAGGAALVVSQFTLYGDTKRGRRPSFSTAGPPALAEKLYLYFCDRLRQFGLSVATGQFQAHMAVRAVNDGPVTLWIDTDTIR